MNNGNKNPHGCSKGKECLKFHPKMCPSSLAHSQCLNDTCSLYHIKGTRRLNSKAANLTLKQRDKHDESQARPRKSQESSESITQESFLEVLNSWKSDLMIMIDKRFEEQHQKAIHSAFPHAVPAVQQAVPHLPYPTAVPQAVLLPGGPLIQQGAHPHPLRY